MKKSKSVFIFLIAAALFLGGCISGDPSGGKNPGGETVTASLSACKEIFEDVSAADTLALRTTLDLSLTDEFSSSVTVESRAVVFEMQANGGNPDAILEYEDDYETFMLYYSDGTFYINRENQKNRLNYDMDSMLNAAYIGFFDTHLLTQNRIKSSSVDAENNKLSVTLDPKLLDNSLIETLSSLGMFKNVTSLKFDIEFTGASSGKIRFEIAGDIVTDVAAQTTAKIVVGMNIEYSFGNERKLLLPDLGQFFYYHEKPINLPLKLMPLSDTAAAFTDSEYIALPQKEQYGQVAANHAYYSRQDGNTAAELCQVTKNGTKKVLLRENFDLISSTLYTFEYRDISEYNGSIYYIGKGKHIYRMPSGGGSQEVLDLGEYASIVVQSKWIFAINGYDSMHAISLDGSRRYSLNNTGSSFSYGGRYLGIDRGYAYFYLNRWSDNRCSYMRLNLNTDDPVLETVQYPFKVENMHLMGICGDVIYYTTAMGTGHPDDEKSKYYVISEKRTAMFPHEDNISYAGFYGAYDFGCLDGKVYNFSYSAPYNISICDLKDNNNKTLLASPSYINPERIRMNGQGLEMVDIDNLYWFGADGTTRHYSLSTRIYM